MKRTGYFLIVGLSGMLWLGTVPGASAAGPQTDEERTKQITIGGAQYFVEGGDMLKIDGESYLMKKDDTGEQVRADRRSGHKSSLCRRAGFEA